MFLSQLLSSKLERFTHPNAEIILQGDFFASSTKFFHRQKPLSKFKGIYI